MTGVIADIALSGHYALVAAGHGGLHIVDVADPTAPRKVGQYQVLDPDQLRDIQVVARAAYVTGFGHLCMVDVSNPPSPRLSAGLASRRVQPGWPSPTGACWSSARAA